MNPRIVVGCAVHCSARLVRRFQRSKTFTMLTSHRLYSHPPDIFHTQTVVKFGLLERCDSQVIDFPGPGNNGRIKYSDYRCRPFPTRKDDDCEESNRDFCTLWWTAGYAAETSVVFGGVAALGIIIGLSTRSRRRRMWKAIAGLEVFHGKPFHTYIWQIRCRIN